MKTNEFSVPPPRFSRAELERLLEVSSAIRCECPSHLASLVSSLQAFERYSETCINRNEKDAYVHQMLHAETGKARLLLEDALEKLCIHEGIPLK